MDSRIVLVRLCELDLQKASGGVLLTIEVTDENILVTAQDDLGLDVFFRRAELKGSLNELHS